MSKNFEWPETVSVFQKERYDGEWMPERLSDAIEWLQAKMAEIPEEYRSSAEIDIESVGGWEASHYATIEITYKRPPTTEEVELRRKAEIERAAADLVRAHQSVEATTRRIAALRS